MTPSSCSREAVQILGGIGYTRGGQGDRIERAYREIKAITIPGGSEEVSPHSPDTAQCILLT